mgnify:CR=1 FL=1
MLEKFTAEWLANSESKVTKSGLYNGNLSVLLADVQKIIDNLTEHNRLITEMSKSDFEDVGERIEILNGKNSTREVKEMIGWTSRKLERTQRSYQSFLNPEDDE